jgi:hypothetical protein
VVPLQFILLQDMCVCVCVCRARQVLHLHCTLNFSELILDLNYFILNILNVY